MQTIKFELLQFTIEETRLILYIQDNIWDNSPNKITDLNEINWFLKNKLNLDFFKKLQIFFKENNYILKKEKEIFDFYNKKTNFFKILKNNKEILENFDDESISTMQQSKLEPNFFITSDTVTRDSILDWLDCEKNKRENPDDYIFIADHNSVCSFHI